MSSWDYTYYDAKKAFDLARDCEGRTKAGRLKEAYNYALGLPDYYPGKEELLAEIERYARNCGINLSEISGYYPG